MNGEASTMTTGNTIAAASSHTAARRGTVTSSDDSSTTGSKVIAHIAHNETISILKSSAAKAGSASDAKNAISAKRRSAVCGQAVSAIAAILGRARSSPSTSGAAM